MLKPTSMNRGIGIHIFQTFDQLREIMAESYGIGRGKRENDPVQNDNWEEDFIKITILEL